MRRIPIFAVALMFLVTTVLLVRISAAGDEEGKKLYTSKCQLCHGIKGDAKGSAAAYLNSPTADFTDPKFWEKHDDKEISDSIVNGKGEMPAFDLTPGELKALIKYIHTFKMPTK